MPEDEPHASTQSTSQPADSRFQDLESQTSAGVMGMALFIASLSVLFAASMVGYLVVRIRADAWPPPGMPRLPAGLWLSTLILLASSVTMHWALRGAKSNCRKSLKAGISITALLGLAFLISQTINWWALVSAELTASVNLYGFTFFILTGLHAIHVIGGLIPMGVVTRRAFLGRYSSTNYAGVLYCAMYWHFLDVVWVVMFVLMVVAA